MMGGKGVDWLMVYKKCTVNIQDRHIASYNFSKNGGNEQIQHPEVKPCDFCANPKIHNGRMVEGASPPMESNQFNL